jgi:hypothetical protein
VYDWSGAFSGSGNNKTTGTTASNYQAYVRSALTSDGVTCYSDYATATGTINVVPGAPAMGGGGTQCGGTRSITATTGTNGNGIRWTDGGNTSPRSVGTGTYYAVSTTNAGCESSSAGVTVTIYTAVGAASIIGNSTNACPTTTVSLTASAENATNFTWYADGTPVQTGASNAYTVSNTGNFAVMGSNEHCTGSTSAYHPVAMNPCGTLTLCASIVLYQYTQPYDCFDTWAQCKTYCTDRGARLPDLAELQCMGNNYPGMACCGGTLPTEERYWSSNMVNVGAYKYDYLAVPLHCGSCGYSQHDNMKTNPARCVK